jgi:hypothetical protein
LKTTLELLDQANSAWKSKADQTEWLVKNIAYREKSMNTKGKSCSAIFRTRLTVHEYG